MQSGTAATGTAHDHYLSGRMYKARSALTEAEACYRDAIRLQPGHVDAWISLGILLRETGQLAEAAHCQAEACRLDPYNFPAILNLANALLAQGQVTAAAECYRRAFELNPGSMQASNGLGTALLELDQPAEAVRYFTVALQLDSRNFMAAEGLGTSLYRAACFGAAIFPLSAACTLAPDAVEVRLLLAESLLCMNRLEEAGMEMERILASRPDWAPALGTQAAIHAAKGEYDLSRELFERALQSEPGDPYLRYRYALLLLRQGEFSTGWQYYEARWQAGGAEKERIRLGFPQPQWQGEPLSDKTLLILCEQGLGDEILFASVVPEILQEARHCLVECDRRLEPLFRRSFPEATVIGVDRKKPKWWQALEQKLDRLPPFDYWVPAGTLPQFKRRSAEAFPRHSGYLLPHTASAVRWRSRLESLGPGLKVGLSWRGGTAISHAAFRTLELAQLLPQIAVEGVRFVNLQYDTTAEEKAHFDNGRFPLHHWPEALADYDETAALVSSLDLVISVCTSIVHLAGALGQSVWVMAPHVAAWRYGNSGHGVIWYPSARIFRQDDSRQWAPVLREVKRALDSASCANS